MEYFASNQFYIHEIMPHELGTNIQICIDLTTDFDAFSHCNPLYKYPNIEGYDTIL